jgi:hypothetical protein
MRSNSLTALFRRAAFVLALGSVAALGACTVEEPASDDVASTAQQLDAPTSAQAVPASRNDSFEAESICPRTWTCDGEGSFENRRQCLDSGCPTCVFDYDCHSTVCICP